MRFCRVRASICLGRPCIGCAERGEALFQLLYRLPESRNTVPFAALCDDSQEAIRVCKLGRQVFLGIPRGGAGPRGRFGVNAIGLWCRRILQTPREIGMMQIEDRLIGCGRRLYRSGGLIGGWTRRRRRDLPRCSILGAHPLSELISVSRGKCLIRAEVNSVD